MDAAHLASFAAECSDGCRSFIHGDLDVSDDLKFVVNTVLSELRATDVMTGAKLRTCFIRYMKHLFQDIDFLATPTCGQTAEPVNENDEKCKK